MAEAPRSFHILAVDDDASVLFALAYALRHYGHSVETVRRADEALARIVAQPDAFELLITDSRMPGLSGVELVTALRAMAFRGRILVLSAYLSPETERAFRAQGVELLLRKPFEMEELLRLVEQTTPPVA